jgi:hypothetical protein
MSDEFFESPINLQKTIQSQFSFNRLMSFTQSDIPSEIASQRVQLSSKDKYFYDKGSKQKSKSFDRVVNERLWKTTPVSSHYTPRTLKVYNATQKNGDNQKTVFNFAGLALSASDSDDDMDEVSMLSTPSVEHHQPEYKNDKVSLPLVTLSLWNLSRKEKAEAEKLHGTPSTENDLQEYHEWYSPKHL